MIVSGQRQVIDRHPFRTYLPGRQRRRYHHLRHMERPHVHENIKHAHGYGVRGDVAPRRDTAGPCFDMYTGLSSHNWAMVIAAFKPAVVGTTTMAFVNADHLGGTNVVANDDGNPCRLAESSATTDDRRPEAGHPGNPAHLSNTEAKEMSYDELPSLWLPIVVCLCMIAIFHGWLIRWKPLSERRWKKVDYIWLSLAAISLLTLTGSGRSKLASLALPESERYVRMSNDLALQSALTWQRVYCIPRGQVENPDDEQKNVVEQWNISCKLFTEAVALVREELSKDKPHLHRELFDDIVKPATRSMGYEEMRTSFFSFVDDASKDADELENLRTEASGNVVALAIAFFGPYLLAIGLALRITKVTGELTIKKVG